LFCLNNILELHMAKVASKYIETAPKLVCEGTGHLEKYFQDIIDQGGEGIILRDPSAPYEAGRSRGYLKHKVTIYKIKTYQLS
jgi:DNA ligase 1